MAQSQASERVVKILTKPNTRLKFKELCAKAHISPNQLNEAIYEIRKSRPDLLFGKFDKTYWFSDTPTWYSNQTDLSREMPEAGLFGVVSDTHLGSVAERIDVLKLAYDEFERLGVKTIFHCGDMSDGWKEYRNHINFVKVHGDQEQAKYVIDNYPRRPGMKTYVIGGNHDDSYAASKVDRLSLVTHGFHHNGKEVKGRDDIVYVGQYSHYFILPQEIKIHLLHPRGGSSYARSYKQQKRSEDMNRNQRPDVQFSGHFHTHNYLFLDGTHFVACPGFQDETEFFKRLGFGRSIGWQVVEYEIFKGKLKYFAPKLFMIE